MYVVLRNIRVEVEDFHIRTRQTLSSCVLGNWANTVKVTWITFTLSVQCCQLLTSRLADPLDLVLDSSSPMNGFTEPQMNFSKIADVYNWKSQSSFSALYARICTKSVLGTCAFCFQCSLLPASQCYVICVP